jgi:alanine dehydrogenase
MTAVLFSAREVMAAVSPERAIKAVREAFIAYWRGEWVMPPKVYLGAYPAGDFRAMPALGANVALLKWVTSFPGNPERGLPTVTGVVLVSSAEDGRLVALLDAASLTAIRTGAAAVLAAETLGRKEEGQSAVIGAGVNGEAAARSFAARGMAPLIWDIDRSRSARVADSVGGRVARDLEEALSADFIATVTPGHSILLSDGSLQPGQHVSLMGADGPGKAEIASSELARVRVFCDDWEQASHGGECSAAVKAGLLRRENVTEIGAVLAGDAEGRRSPDEITAFDSTGLALQDLAVALVALERMGDTDLPTIDL